MELVDMDHHRVMRHRIANHCQPCSVNKAHFIGWSFVSMHTSYYIGHSLLVVASGSAPGAGLGPLKNFGIVQQVEIPRNDSES